MSYTTIPWPSQHVDKVWEKALPHLQPAIDLNNGYLADDVLAGIKDERLQLFVIAGDDNEVVGAIVTTIIVYPRKKTCFVLFLGGKDMRHWQKDAEKLTTWASIMGCDDIEAIGRPGLEKYFPAESTGFRLYRRILGGH